MNKDKLTVIKGSRHILELELLRIILTEHNEDGQKKMQIVLNQLEKKGKLTLVKP